MYGPDGDEELEDEFEARLRSRRRLMEKGRGESGRSFWSYLGLIGVVGWSVVVPMVLGILAGLWLDRRFGTGYKLTLGLMLLGLFVGCLNAWRMITREQ